MLVFPEPFGPSSPMTSPVSTSRDTRSTARWGPYHFVSWSATMTEGMASSGHRAAGRWGRPTVACLLEVRGRITYSKTWGACDVRALPAGPSGSWAVMKLAFSRPWRNRMYSYALRMPVGL